MHRYILPLLQYYKQKYPIMYFFIFLQPYYLVKDSQTVQVELTPLILLERDI